VHRRVGVEQAFLGGAAKRGAMGEALAEVDVPRVEVGIEVHQGDLAESSVHRLQERVGNGVVATDGDQAVDGMRAVRRAQQLACPCLDRGE
jgi:hypothetical protein